MFTGIIEARGRVRAITPRGRGTDLTIEAPFAGELAVGQSVAVSGICFTVTVRDAHTFGVTAVPETLSRTALGALQPGDTVNLERAVRAGDRLDGHLVQGHVDGVGRVVRTMAARPGMEAVIALDRALMRYVATKGSVAVDGVSLTVAGLEDGAFRVALVPHTLEVTTLGRIRPGRRVNVEIDVTARYIERLMNHREVSVE